MTGKTPATYDPFAHIYDLQHRPFADDVPLYLRLSQLAKDAALPPSLLEIGCGTGRLMQPLVEAGYRVVGVDESQAMLDIAESHLRDATGAGSYRLVHADARMLALDEQFGLAYIPLNTFLHCLTRSDQLAMLHAVRKHLPVGASIILDVPPNDEMSFQPDDGEFQHESTFVDPQTNSEMNKFVSSRIFWATQEQALTYKVEERRDGQLVNTTTFGFRLRHVFKHELELLLLNSGFVAPRWLGDYDMNDYVEGSRRMIAVAKATPSLPGLPVGGWG